MNRAVSRLINLTNHISLKNICSCYWLGNQIDDVTYLYYSTKTFINFVLDKTSLPSNSYGPFELKRRQFLRMSSSSEFNTETLCYFKTWNSDKFGKPTEKLGTGPFFFFFFKPSSSFFDSPTKWTSDEKTWEQRLVGKTRFLCSANILVKGQKNDVFNMFKKCRGSNPLFFFIKQTSLVFESWNKRLHHFEVCLLSTFRLQSSHFQDKQLFKKYKIKHLFFIKICPTVVKLN